MTKKQTRDKETRELFEQLQRAIQALLKALEKDLDDNH